MDGHGRGRRIPDLRPPVTLEFLEWSFESVVFFAEDTGFRRNVLGRNGWLNRCRIAIVDHDQMLYVSQYDE